jgi:hypothetical protein
MGYAVSEIPYIVLAEQLGIGSADISRAKVRELNNSQAGQNINAAGSGKVRSLAAYVNEDKACSACYSSLIFALSRMGRNETARLREKICVGQGFQGKKGTIGVGQCCAGFTRHCPGCPPSGVDILSFLRI